MRHAATIGRESPAFKGSFCGKGNVCARRCNATAHRGSHSESGVLSGAACFRHTPCFQAGSSSLDSFFADQDGIPVSRNNRVFDLCIRGQPVFLPLIRMNPDRVQLDQRGKVLAGASCQKYSLHDGRWRHPDYPELEYFTLTLKPQVLLTVPAPYVILLNSPAS